MTAPISQCKLPDPKELTEPNLLAKMVHEWNQHREEKTQNAATEALNQQNETAPPSQANTKITVSKKSASSDTALRRFSKIPTVTSQDDVHLTPSNSQLRSLET